MIVEPMSAGAGRWLRARAGSWGEFIHRNEPTGPADLRAPCPFCGCFAFFAFCSDGPENAGTNWSNPFDLFECAECGAVITRFDGLGPESWDRWRAFWQTGDPAVLG